MKRNFNEDYKQGMQFLLRHAPFNVRYYQWIPYLSYKLSLENACFKFWYNAYRQNRLFVIKNIRCFNGIFHEEKNCCFFFWGETTEGFGFWQKIENKLIDTVDDNIFLNSSNIHKTK